MRYPPRTEQTRVKTPRATATDCRESPTGAAARATDAQTVTARLIPTLASSRSTGQLPLREDGADEGKPGHERYIRIPSTIRDMRNVRLRGHDRQNGHQTRTSEQHQTRLSHVVAFLPSERLSGPGVHDPSSIRETSKILMGPEA